jgi:hypothetical protein
VVASAQAVKGTDQVRRFPLIAGLDRDQWAARGMVMSRPNGRPVVTAEEAERIALTQTPGATNGQPTLVRVEMPRSQFFPSADYWAVSMTPPPGMVGSGGPAHHKSTRPPLPFAHLVIFVDAGTGRVPLTHIWQPRDSRSRMVPVAWIRNSTSWSRRTVGMGALLVAGVVGVETISGMGGLPNAGSGAAPVDSLFELAERLSPLIDGLLGKESRP